MIVFDLSCDSGHRFEGWFGSSDEFERQVQGGVVNCPTCGSSQIAKAPTAVAVPRKGNRQPTPANMAGGRIAPEAADMLRKIASMQAEALKTSTWVGEDFVEQSRKMHYGEQDTAPIHGKATPDEARGLAEEGIAVLPLLIPVAPPEELN